MTKSATLKIGVSLAALLLLGAGCYSAAVSNKSITNTANTATTGGGTVSINNFAFSPSSMTVSKGTTVTWTNNDTTSHTVTGDNGGPSSGTITPGKTYSFTFDTVGTFAYHCNFHGGMTGNITVTQ